MTTDLVKRLEAGDASFEIGIEVSNVMFDDCPADARLLCVQAVQGCLNSAVALVERVLPGWRKGLRQHEDIEGDGWTAWVESPNYRVTHWNAGDEDRSDVVGIYRTGDAPTAAAAIIAALLKAERGE